MLGLGILVRLGRTVVGGALAEAGLLPSWLYRHLALAALEEDDFPGALQYLKYAEDPLLTQILVLRLRLLIFRHQRQRRAWQALWQQGPCAEMREKCQELLAQEERALRLLSGYENKGVALLAKESSSGPRSGPT